jgi:hypothetical protein
VGIYALQKLIRDVNRNGEVRRAFMEAPADTAARYHIPASQIDLLVARDYGQLYRLGVHPLLLRPFSIIHGVREEDYLHAIRRVG